MTPANQAVMQNWFRRLQPYACAVRIDDLHIVVKAWCAASATYDHIFKIGHLKQHAMLYVTKSFLTETGEYVAYIGHEPPLDIIVEVNELKAGIFGQSAAKCGFAAPHVADEENGLCHVKQ